MTSETSWLVTQNWVSWSWFLNWNVTRPGACFSVKLTWQEATRSLVLTFPFALALAFRGVVVTFSTTPFPPEETVTVAPLTFSTLIGGGGSGSASSATPRWPTRASRPPNRSAARMVFMAHLFPMPRLSARGRQLTCHVHA